MITRKLTLYFTLLLSAPLALMLASFVTTSIYGSAMEKENKLLNLIGRQRMLAYQYNSEVSHVLVALASSNMEMALAEKKKLDLTSQIFEDTHTTFINGGRINAQNHNIPDSTTIPPINDRELRDHFDQIQTEWREQKRIALLSLRTDTHSISESPYVHRLLDQATRTAAAIDIVINLMRHRSDARLKRLKTQLMAAIIVGLAFSLFTIYFVYKRFILPLDHSLNSLKDATTTLAQERDRAETASQAKSEFLSRMSHELRTPLNAILGFTQLIELDVKGNNETHEEYTREIIAAGQHLLVLINEVLDLEKIESGDLKITLKHTPVASALKQCLALINTQAELRQVEIIDNVSATGLVVNTDPIRLKQIFINLLSNAVKYTIDHGIITLNSTITDQQWARISVTNTGEGLSAKDIAKLFTPFERLNARHNIEGTGIGLVICKHLTKLMGGNIGVESIPGESCTFWVEFRLADDT